MSTHHEMMRISPCCLLNWGCYDKTGAWQTSRLNPILFGLEKHPYESNQNVESIVDKWRCVRNTVSNVTNWSNAKDLLKKIQDTVYVAIHKNSIRVWGKIGEYLSYEKISIHMENLAMSNEHFPLHTIQHIHFISLHQAEKFAAHVPYGFAMHNRNKLVMLS